MFRRFTNSGVRSVSHAAGARFCVTGPVTQCVERRVAPSPAPMRPSAGRFLGSAPQSFGRLDDKVIVVCGAGNPPAEGHGIGAATSIELARRGAKVVSVSNEALNAETVAGAIGDEGYEGLSHVADCRNPDEVEALANRVVEEYGRVDVVINAGIHSALPMGFHKMTDQAWAAGISLNLTAHFEIVHKFLPHFVRQRSGNFIHFTTIASSVGLGIGRQRHAYAAGKAGAATLTKRIGIEYAKQGIRGNVVSIGYVSGPLVNRAVAQAGADLAAVTSQRDSYVPRGTQGQPEEVAKVAAFLASDDSSLVNGTEIYCDGGSHGCTYGP